MNGIKQKVNAWATCGVEILQEGITETSSGSSTRHILTVEAEVAGRDCCKSSGTVVETENHFWCGSFLRRKDVGSSVFATKWIGNIGSNGKADVLQFLNVIPRPMFGKTVDDGTNHTDAAITGGTAAKTNDDVSTTLPYGVCNELSRPVTGSYHWVPLFCGEQRETTGLSDFDDGCVAIDEIVGSNGPHQRIPHSLLSHVSTECIAKGLQPTFATVADGYLNDFGIWPFAHDALCCCLIGLLRGQASFEGVDGCDNRLFHIWYAVLWCKSNEKICNSYID